MKTAKTVLAITALAVATLVSAGPAGAQPHEWTLHTGISQGRLGAQVMDLTGDLRQFFGAPTGVGLLVSKVLPDSPAARAGMRAGDVLTEVNGQSIEHFRDVLSALSGKDKGDKVAVTVIRDKRKVKLEATLQQGEVRLPGFGEPPGDLWKEFGPGNDRGERRWKSWGEPSDHELDATLKKLSEQMKAMEKRLKKLEERR